MEFEIVMWSKLYISPDKNIWTGRVDSSQKDRFHELISLVNLAEVKTQASPTVALLGFCSDVGVKRNHGRVGAAQGPKAIRHALANLPFHRDDIAIHDVGDVTCLADDLELAQQALGKTVSILLENNYFPIILGGGHETAWGHYQGLKQNYKNLAICNFDAHFDLRDLIDNKYGSSGTPFWQIYQDSQDNQLTYDYTCLGVQLTANTQSLFNRADKLGVNYILADELHWGDRESYSNAIKRILTGDKKVYVTFCLDVLAASVAPGVSSPQPAGLYLAQVIPLLRQLAQSKKVVGFDIVELAPNYDQNEQTAKSAAVLIAEWLHHLK